MKINLESNQIRCFEISVNSFLDRSSIRNSCDRQDYFIHFYDFWKNNISKICIIWIVIKVKVKFQIVERRISEFLQKSCVTNLMVISIYERSLTSF